MDNYFAHLEAYNVTQSAQKTIHEQCMQAGFFARGEAGPLLLFHVGFVILLVMLHRALCSKKVKIAEQEAERRAEKRARCETLVQLVDLAVSTDGQKEMGMENAWEMFVDAALTEAEKQSVLYQVSL